MTSPLVTLPAYRQRFGARAIVSAVCIGFASVCALPAGVANAGDFPVVRYELSGSSPVAETITYQTNTGQIHQANVKLPWSTQFNSFGGEVFLLSAQSEGSVTCSISLDGNVVKNATATGAPARTVCTH